MFLMIIQRVVKKQVEVQGLGQKLRAAQRQSDCSVREVARQIGVSTSYWYQLIKEEEALSYDLLQKIIRILNVEVPEASILDE
jgi:transcriptional regulator with XRE-family HTH domain